MNEVEQLHRFADQVCTEATNVEIRAESIATEAREIRHAAERLRQGNATYDDIVALRSTADELEHLLRSELDNALDTVRSIRL
ncbi:hypothetical protein [Tsukamurella spumae]|uniref:Uncharacterized protein n=1 Tax=Tsukamurella spumae TaxID=44753 RepID=A0A846X3X0_9ACTN|nr:hypothetical protein [Tsukamurella spumae]NKY18892.1 hypothetical protein [Tsukamurella spumae]